MLDVLETLRKLPPECLAVHNGEVFKIRRGAQGLRAFPHPKDQVDQWNHGHGVSPQQVQAMIVGATLGWDMDGADPDTHAEDLDEKPGPFTYDFVVVLAHTMQIEAPTLEEATKKARTKSENLCDQICFDLGRGANTSVENIDLIETDDPHA